MEKTLTREFLLTPANSNAEKQLPLTLLISEIIEIATEHANRLGIGFLNIDASGIGWVLSRVTVEMRRWPVVGEKYSITTWVETYNKHFSERCFSVESEEGETLGLVRTVWVIIDLKSHKSVGTAGLDLPSEIISDRPCPILRQMRHKPFTPQKTVEYTFKYSDVDYYRHVNTMRYVSLLLNQFPLSVYDDNHLSRFEVAFMNEARCGQTAVINSIVDETETPEFIGDVFSKHSTTTTFEMNVDEKPILRARITFTPRKQDHQQPQRPNSPTSQQAQRPNALISTLVSTLSPSATLAMSQKSAELKAEGIDVINLSVGEPDFNTPEFIKEAAKKAIDDNFTFYTPVAGYMSLRKAIVDNLKQTNGVDYSPEQIVVSNGAKQSLANVILSVVNPGDEVVIPTPAWVSYMELVKLAGGKTVEVPAGIDSDFKISAEQLERALTPKTKLIILCSPCNPSGSVYSPEELRRLVDVIARHPQVVVLSDEIYQHINYTRHFKSMGAFPEIADRTVVVNGVSKAYAMTGWRIGFIAAPLEIAKACTKLQSQTTSNPSSIAQKAAEAAFSGPQRCVEEMRQAFERRRDLIVSLAREIPGLKTNRPEGAFYLFPDVSDYLGKKAGDKLISTDADLAMYLLEEAHVATVAGSAFSLPGYIRISYAASDSDIKEAMARIATALQKLS